MMLEVDGVIKPLKPRSHQTFRVTILKTLLRNRYNPTTFHIITGGGTVGWCLNWPV